MAASPKKPTPAPRPNPKLSNIERKGPQVKKAGRRRAREASG